MRSADVNEKIGLIPTTENRAIARVICDLLIARGVQPITRESGTGGRIDFSPVPLSIWINRGGTLWLHNDMRNERNGYPEIGLSEIPGYDEPSARRRVFDEIRAINNELTTQIGSKDTSTRQPQPSLSCFRNVVDVDAFLAIYDPIIDAALRRHSTI